MANLSKIKRDRMIAFLEQLKGQHSDDASIRAFNEIENQLRDKKYGLVWEEHSEAVDEMLKENIPIFCEDKERKICKDSSLPYNFIIEGDNLQALYLLEKTHLGKVDCIYIDPPYNTGAKDWKYNNNYVDGNDVYRHSKWLSMMKARLSAAKHLLNPKNSVLIVTIDEKEYLHLGCLLEEMFQSASLQMISSVINPQGVQRKNQFSRTDEYIFIVQLGGSQPCAQLLSEEWSAGNNKIKFNSSPRWSPVRRMGSHSTREEAPNQFYPIYIEKKTGKILGCGTSLPMGQSRTSVGCNNPDIALVWPMRPDGTEGCWQLSQQTVMERLERGFIRVISKNEFGWIPTTMASGEIAKVEKGIYKLVERSGTNNEVKLESNSDVKYMLPGTQWRISSHIAGLYGNTLIKNILGSSRFSFPKSVYAVHDVINFFVANKKNALIIDFFAGSGTTLHAVNLLNAEDGGQRRCILVTNNEVSYAEAKDLTNRGYKPGAPEWEALGIAKYVTWPRTLCSIEGHDINGKPLNGDYLSRDKDGNPIPMSRGFNANVKYFKCGWTPRKPENYLLSNALCLHIKEMIELQNAIEVDNLKNVLILNKDDLKTTVMNPEVYGEIENIWLNQSIILDADEIKLLQAKGFHYIPREFFSHELREAAE